MKLSYEIVQERYEGDSFNPISDFHPVHFATMEDAINEWKSRGVSLFENPDKYADYYVLELDENGVMTGESFNLVTQEQP